MTIPEIGSRKSFVIGPITVDPGRNILRNESHNFALEPKIMDVLEYLAVHQGRVCSRDDIIAAVWKVEYGADESLTRAISVIRKTLRKAGGQGRYIQTISKRGYSLQEPIAISADAAAAPTVLVDTPEPGLPSVTETVAQPPHPSRGADLKQVPPTEPEILTPKPAPVIERPSFQEKNVTTAVASKMPDSQILTTSKPRNSKVRSLGLIFSFFLISTAAAVV